MDNLPIQMVVIFGSLLSGRCVSSVMLALAGELLHGGAEYVPSKEIKEELKDHGIEKDVKIWARGGDGDVFNPHFRCRAWRSSIGVEEKEVVVLLVSRMVWEKNLELFARTVKGLPASGLVGEGPAKRHFAPTLLTTGACR